MYDQTIEMLHQFKGQYREIAESTGLDYDWLHQVSRGVIKDPGIKKIEVLNAHLLKLTKSA